MIRVCGICVHCVVGATSSSGDNSGNVAIIVAGVVVLCVCVCVLCVCECVRVSFGTCWLQT